MTAQCKDRAEEVLAKGCKCPIVNWGFCCISHLCQSIQIEYHLQFGEEPPIHIGKLRGKCYNQLFLHRSKHS